MRPRSRSRFAFLLLAVALGTAMLLFGDKQLTISIRDYMKKRERSTSQEAYERALDRIKDARLGMKTDAFFETMKMLMIRDEKGEGIDGFVEGYLQQASLKMSKGKENDRYLVFGYFKKWKSNQGQVKKFYVVFRHKILREIAFFDPKEDKWGISGKVK